MDMTIIEQAKGLADKVLAQPATEHDIAVVERQLGRYPRGMVAVGARCVCGRLWLWSPGRCFQAVSRFPTAPAI